MKNLNLIKLIVGIILILFGMYFGVLIINNDLKAFGLIAILLNGPERSSTATYTPFYGGICIVAGTYLIGKIGNRS